MENQLAIGSLAAKWFYVDYRSIKDHDADYLVDGEIENDKEWNQEYHNANQGVGYRWLYDNKEDKNVAQKVLYGHFSFAYVLEPKYLHTLKLAHCFWNFNWRKTMSDILFFQNKFVDHDEKLLDLLYEDNKKIHGDKKAKLNKDNEDFFNDHVERIYVHDTLHDAMSYYEEPLYQRIKKDKSKAATDYDLFLALEHHDKLRLCREEIYVTALERFLIPKDFKEGPIVAYRNACCQLITSMTKGWFPRFIALNWRDLHRPEIDFVEKFEKQKHKVKKIEV